MTTRRAVLSAGVALQLAVGIVAAGPAHALATPPSAPTLVEGFQVVSAGTVVVYWAASASPGDSPIASYTAVAAPGGQSCQRLAADVPPDEDPWCLISGLTEGTTYTFTVFATNAGADSAPSTASPALTIRPFVVPGAPAISSNYLSGTAAHIVWTAPANSGPPIYRYTVTASPGGATCSTTSVACDIDGVLGGTYEFTVTAENVAGISAPSASTGPMAFVVPATPLNFATTGQTATRATFTWSPVVSTAGFPIQYFVTVPGNASTGCVVDQPSAGVTPSCAVSGLVASTSYTATVVARNAVGTSAPSALVAFTTPAPVTAPTAPTAPQNVTVVGANGAVVVSWGAPVSDGGAPISGYTVQVETALAPPRSCMTTSLSCAFDGLTDGRTYSYTVTARNDRLSTSAAAVTATTQDTIAPAAPLKVTGATAVNALGVSQLSLAWSVDGSNDGTPIVRLATGGVAPTSISEGLPVAPLSGSAAPTAPTNYSARASGFAIGPIAVSVFMVDKAGNVSAPTSLVFTPTIITVLGAPLTTVAGRPTSVTWLLRAPGGAPRVGEKVVAFHRTVGTGKWVQTALVSDLRGRVGLRFTATKNTEVKLQYGG
ncbi:MAG: fibronectin type III domain-containing protein, partial [Mycobacteriales bacterium]